MLSIINVQAGLAATGLCLGGVAIAAAVAMVTAPLTPRLAVAGVTATATGAAFREVRAPQPLVAAPIAATRLVSAKAAIAPVGLLRSAGTPLTVGIRD